MTTFQRLFGITNSEVKNTCMLLPLVQKNGLEWLGVKDLSKGKLYSSGNSKDFTVIHTGMGPALSGDAVLYLEKTPCRNIIVFGSCGLIKEEKDLNIGGLVTPEKCYSMESFTDMLAQERKKYDLFYPDKTLLEKLPEVKKVTCATLGSLKLEEGYRDSFEAKEIQVVDMETSAIFSAAQHIGKKAIALFYITDIINKKPFYRGLSAADRLRLSSSIKSASNILCDLIKKNLRD
ncbi:MAG: hypothetical protein KKD11_04180 [Candidatus Omnitrophica bacterium]|nr:hypothetical protein [Candidatus Omnitrophota bacterium]